jgi:hypothetical protein
MPLRLIAGGKVAGDDFFDREQLIDAIWQELPAHSVELVAPRRSGKTSAMQRLIDEPRGGCRVRFIDCQALRDPNSFISALSSHLLEGQHRQQARHGAESAVGGLRNLLSRIRSVELLKLSINFADSQSPEWSASIDRLLAAARAHPVPTILIVDEFPMMLDYFMRDRTEAKVIVGFLNWFRALRLAAQSVRPGLAFVIGGSISMSYWLGRLNATNTMSDLHPEPIGPFDDHTARIFLGALQTAEQLSWTDEVPDAILSHINPPSPYWLQVLLLLLRQSPARARAITAADVARTYTDDLIGPAGRQFFQPFEERLSHYNDAAIERGVKRLLTNLAAADFEAGLPLATLAVIFAQASGVDSPEVFDTVFADLQSEFYVRYDPNTKRCFFAHKVLRDWWLRWHPTAAADSPPPDEPHED